jgi:hypothetical protein
MIVSPAQMNTLARALKSSGSEQILAKSLGITVEEVGRYLRGNEAVPAGVYFKALDVAAGKRR